jgi:hypothetical protein
LRDSAESLYGLPVRGVPVLAVFEGDFSGKERINLDYTPAFRSLLNRGKRNLFAALGKGFGG